LFCFSCTSKPKSTAVYVTVIDSGRKVKFEGLDYAIVSEISRDSVPGAWANLLPVYRMPADTDMKDYQPVQSGRYVVKDSAVVFTPDTPFMKAQGYFLRYFRFGEGSGISNYIKGEKKIGSRPYTDISFKVN